MQWHLCWVSFMLSFINAECHNAECRNGDCHLCSVIYAEYHLCWVSFMLSVVMVSVIYAECSLYWVQFMLSAVYADCCSSWVSFIAKCRCAECRGPTFRTNLSVLLTASIPLAPLKQFKFLIMANSRQKVFIMPGQTWFEKQFSQKSSNPRNGASPRKWIFFQIKNQAPIAGAFLRDKLECFLPEKASSPLK
jgi:hypothetical protein